MTNKQVGANLEFVFPGKIRNLAPPDDPGDAASKGWVEGLLDGVLDGGIGVTDGNKGDVDVSGGGTIWNIKNGAVTYAKLQPVSAGKVVLGKPTAGSGTVTQIPIGIEPNNLIMVGEDGRLPALDGSQLINLPSLTVAINAFTTTTANFQIPAVNSNVTVAVAESRWMVVGQILFTEFGSFRVQSINNNVSVSLTNLTGIQGTTVSNGSKLSPSGERGLQGIQGIQGIQGQPNSLTIGTVTTGVAGSNASAAITGAAPNQVLNLTIPQGIQGIQGLQGIQGIQGQPNSLTIGTVTTGEAGSNASATITGTAPNQTLSLTIPRGIQGLQGIQGIQGSPGINSFQDMVANIQAMLVAFVN